MKRQLLLAAAVLAAGGALGLISPAQAYDGPPAYVRDHAPPPPRYEPRPMARPGEVWVPGHWRAEGPRYAWRSGYWQPERAGYRYVPDRYVPDRWARGPHGWGYWAR